MINRESSEYQEAKWRVKIGHAFLEEGYDVKGVVHVGANNGYEVQWYLKMGIENALCFEPLPLGIEAFKEKYLHELNAGVVRLFECALGDKEEMRKFYIAPGDGQGSSFLLPTDSYQEEHPEYDYKAFPPITVPVKRFDQILKENPDINLEDYDCLVIDTQGTELEVLKGFGEALGAFKYLNIECSEVPVYEGGAAAQEIINYLKTFGFEQNSPMQVHDDIFFIKK